MFVLVRRNFAVATLLLVLSVPYDTDISVARTLAAAPHQPPAHQPSSPKPSGQKSAHEPSNAELVERLREAQIVDPTYALTATKGSDEVMINTQRNPKLDDNEAKVQAVLMAKTVLEKLPSSVVRAKIVFADHDSQDIVPITRQLLALYGNHKLSENDLKALVEMTKAQPIKKSSGDAEEGIDSLTDAVVDGPQKIRRGVQLSRINKLENAGTNVSQLRSMFDAQEKLAASSKGKDKAQELMDSLARLHSIIREQEQMLKQAHDPILPTPKLYSGGNGSGGGGGFISKMQQKKRRQGQ